MILKRIPKYLIKISVKNPVKVIMLIVALALLHPIFNLEGDRKENIKVITHFKNGVSECYVVPSSGEPGMKIIKSDKELNINSDGTIEVDDENVPLILSWIGFVALIAILVISTFQDDDDYNWSFRDNFIEVLHDDVLCEMEQIGNDEIYYYILDGRLILKSKSHRSRVHDEVEKYFQSPKIFIEYEGTKQKRRSNKLDEILG
jgi:hypothetical protein